MSHVLMSAINVPPEVCGFFWIKVLIIKKKLKKTWEVEGGIRQW
jgi:hypothetical protein